MTFPPSPRPGSAARPTRPALLVSDVDRTLLTRDHVLLPEVVEAAAAARAGGLTIILATARSPTGVGPVARALGASGPLICFNGAWVGRADRAEAWHHRPLPRALAVEVMEAARALGGRPMWFTLRDVQAVEADAGVAEAQANVTGDALRLRPGPEACDGEPSKVMVVVAPEEADAVASDLGRRFRRALAVARSGPHLVEVVAAGTSKAEAAALVADRLGLPPSRIAAAGDAPNDVELLEWAGLPITVANGLERLRDMAAFVAPSCEEGGMAVALRWLAALPDQAPPRDQERVRGGSGKPAGPGAGGGAIKGRPSRRQREGSRP